MAALLGATGFASPARSESPKKPAIRLVEVVGTEFRITRTDGRVLSRSEAIGAVLTIRDAKGARLTFRIDAAKPDPNDPSGEIILYTLMVRDTATGKWSNLCRPGPDGLAMGFPLSGVWSPDGRHLRTPKAFSLTCTSGVIGKCVRMGYMPWKTAKDGTSLWPYHQACTRMMRADYCGDGTPFTRDGTRINIYDRLGIQVANKTPDLSFEAAWGPDGAVCIRKVRIPEKASLSGLAKRCPKRLLGKVGATCTKTKATGFGAVYIMNDS